MNADPSRRAAQGDMLAARAGADPVLLFPPRHSERNPCAGGHLIRDLPMRPPVEELRVVDLCAGLGGFHRALQLAEITAGRRQRRFFPRARSFRCVLAAELDQELREVYVRNFPEIVDEYSKGFPPEKAATVAGLKDLYEDGRLKRIHGDIRHLIKDGTDELQVWPGEKSPIVPAHDLLCAGFPCQPFSKSGAQKGFADLKGTVFEMIRIILAHHKPRFVLLENVGNFQAHDKGNTWTRVRQVLEGLGYDWRATTHVGGIDGGQGLLSPHHLGHPHHRERFFVVAQMKGVEDAFPLGYRPFPKSFRSHIAPGRELERVEAVAEGRLRRLITWGAAPPREELLEAQIQPERVRCIEHWSKLLRVLRERDEAAGPDAKLFDPLPSFPIWGYELDPWNHYPYQTNPGQLLSSPPALLSARRAQLTALQTRSWWRPELSPGAPRDHLGELDPDEAQAQRWAAGWPEYARGRDEWPRWKQRFIEQNRQWSEILWANLDGQWLRGWLDELYTMTPSHQKLEWNCLGDKRDIWDHILQFRPSGLRVKRFRHVPALVAMTCTQIPIVPRLRPGEATEGAAPGALGRHLLPTEALELQGFPPRWHRPATRAAAFKAFGNAVHAGLVSAVVVSWLFENQASADEDRGLQLASPGRQERLAWGDAQVAGGAP